MKLQSSGGDRPEPSSSSHLLSGLLSVAEGCRDFGPDVGGPPLLTDDVGQQVDEHLVVLQQRHRAVLPVKGHVGPQGPDGDVDLAWVLPLSGLPHNQQGYSREPEEKQQRAEAKLT